jgi:hypothetical protein
MIFSNTLQQPNLPFQQCHSRASALRICLKLIVVAIIATDSVVLYIADIGGDPSSPNPASRESSKFI